MIAAWLIAAPVFLGGPQNAAKDWAALVERYEAVSGASVNGGPQTIVIETSGALPPGHAGASALGRIRLRDASTLRHELAHQLLLIACAQATGDRLFHEAFAVAVSGELEQWIDEGYFSSAKAVAALQSGAIDTAVGRRALARLLSDGAQPGRWPLAIERRVKRCAAGERWLAMTPSELSSSSEPLRRDAFVVLSRHSGEVLIKEGDVEAAMPFGSTLKPFVAAAGTPARLPVDASDPLWRCGEGVQKTMTIDEALSRSCNGYFLKWGVRSYGAFEPVLLALGLAHAPESIDEAIGLRPTLALSPWAIAQAYRAFAAARPEILKLLEATPHTGTLNGLGVQAQLAGAAVKSGTVRDPDNNVQLGWLVAVTTDHVAVMARVGKMPRAFADEFASRVAKLRQRELEGVARVQVFTLLDPSDVQLQCDGVLVQLRRELSGGAKTFRAVSTLVPASGDRAMCLGRPFTARFNGSSRFYAGEITRVPLPPPLDPAAPKARRGSEIVFSTTEARYVASVLRAEDATIIGEAKRALAKVILHNVRNADERHAGRPVCDTTHCQVFLGTPDAAAPKGITAVAPWIDRSGWLPFSRGGDEPWTEERSLADVTRVIGAVPLQLVFSGGEVTVHAVDGAREIDETFGCERVRGPLKLPSCPQAALIAQRTVTFRGRGKGHGLGLDVEAAKASGKDADAILKAAYR